MKGSNGFGPKHEIRRPRILYIQPCSSFGGAERQASLNIPRLLQLGFEVVPLVGPGDTVVSWLRENGVEDVVHDPTLPGGWSKPTGLERLKLPGRYVRSWYRTRRHVEELVRARDIDLIFAALPFAWVVATPIARKFGVPVIWRAGGTEITPAQRAVLAMWATLNAPDLLVCCGDSVQSTYGPLVRAPSLVVANGVDTEKFRPDAGDPARYRPPGAGIVIGFAGRLVPQKRPEDMIQVASVIAARHPDAVFLFAGDGSRRPEYQELARSLNVERQVRFLGYVADMRSFYAACDIFALPSRAEGRPNVVLESMAMRRAVVVSDAPGTREVVRDGRDGMVFPVGDLAAFAAALTQVIEQPAFRRSLIARAYDRVTTTFSVQASTQRLADVLRAAIDLGADARASRRLPASDRSGWLEAPTGESTLAQGGGRW
jgi:glycosyltransferase involved in cell wall biosynthesis